MKLFVHNFPYETTDRELRDLFVEFGATGAAIVYRPEDGRSAGFGHVEIPDAARAKAAIAALDGSNFGGRRLHVERYVEAASAKRERAA